MLIVDFLQEVPEMLGIDRCVSAHKGSETSGRVNGVSPMSIFRLSDLNNVLRLGVVRGDGHPVQIKEKPTICFTDCSAAATRILRASVPRRTMSLSRGSEAAGRISCRDDTALKILGVST